MASRERVAAHKAAYWRGFDGEAETDEIANDPQLRRSYRMGARARRGEAAPKYAGKRSGPENAPGSPQRDQAASDVRSPADASESPAAATTASPPGAAGRIVRRASGSAGGFTLGLLAYAIGVNYLRYGVPGVKALAQAKLFNNVTPGPWAGQQPPAAGGSSTSRPTALRVVA